MRQAEELAATQKVHEATVDKQRDAAKKLAEVRPRRVRAWGTAGEAERRKTGIYAVTYTMLPWLLS